MPPLLYQITPIHVACTLGLDRAAFNLERRSEKSALDPRSEGVILEHCSDSKSFSFQKVAKLLARLARPLSTFPVSLEQHGVTMSFDVQKRPLPAGLLFWILPAPVFAKAQISLYDIVIDKYFSCAHWTVVVVVRGS